MDHIDKDLEHKLSQGIAMMEKLTLDEQIEVIEAGIIHHGASPGALALLRLLKEKKKNST